MRKSATTPERRTASHCDALLGDAEPAEELGAAFDAIGERIASALRRMIAASWGDPALRVRNFAVHTGKPDELVGLLAPLAASSIHAFGKMDRLMLLSIEGRALLEQLDRAFGGSGDLGEDLPEKLSGSAELFAQRFAGQVAATIAGELGDCEFRQERSETAITRHSPFAAKSELAILELEITGADSQPWRLILAVETAALPELLPPRTPRPSRQARRGGGASEAPFADLPLIASATLVDMQVPLHRLATIEAGAVIPIQVNRSVPLSVGNVIMARGTVGEIDDRVAIEITRTLFGKDNK